MGQYKRKLKKGERWFYSGQYLGVKYFSKAIYLTKQEAKNAERKHITDLDEQARNPHHREINLLYLINERLDEIKIKRSKTYYRMSRAYFIKLVTHTGNVPVHTISRETLHKLFEKEANRLKAAGKTNHKLNEFIRVVKALFNFGIKVYECMNRNPCVGLDLYPIDIKTKYIPTDEEIAELRKKLNHNQRLLFDFVDLTGCRIMEAVTFFNNPETDGNLLTLYTRKSKNSNLTPRRIPDPHIQIAREWTAYPRFLGELTNGMWNWHNLRHRRASIWANQGMSIIELMNRLGHSNLVTTQRYLQLLGFTSRV